MPLVQKWIAEKSSVLGVAIKYAYTARLAATKKGEECVKDSIDFIVS
jgi:hypothetical protein